MKNRIRIERAIADMTQANLADKMQVSRQTINAIEANKYVPSLALGLKIAKLFGRRVEEIFELEDTD
jgi:putative transcriptional regulator